MNKIVFEHYPASKVPDELRQEIDASATVKIVIEEEAREAANETWKWPGSPTEQPREPLTIEDTLEMIRRYKALGRPSVTPEEAVARIRELRDEWDY